MMRVSYNMLIMFITTRVTNNNWNAIVQALLTSHIRLHTGHNTTTGKQCLHKQ